MRADDPFRDRYARGTRSMTASEIRALFAVASRPEVVSLAGGMPFTAALPFDVVGDVLQEVVATEGPAALQYAGGQGDPRMPSWSRRAPSRRWISSPACSATPAT
ncbi:MAG TPA: hypothetical protein VG499_10945 [Actinomycetota bacterium]|nr:hypothetical protein [Actinomycetota bacterium]